MEFQRVNISGGSSFEEVAGYSRIVKADPFVFVSGTTAVTPEGTVYGEGDPYAQAKYIFTKLVKLLEENGVSKEEVVKVNIWATSSSYNMEITKAYSEFFKESRPCCTWIGIKELNRPTQLVEIEMQAAETSTSANRTPCCSPCGMMPFIIILPATITGNLPLPII